MSQKNMKLNWLYTCIVYYSEIINWGFDALLILLVDSCTIIIYYNTDFWISVFTVSCTIVFFSILTIIITMLTFSVLTILTIVLLYCIMHCIHYYYVVVYYYDDYYCMVNPLSIMTKSAKFTCMPANHSVNFSYW